MVHKIRIHSFHSRIRFSHLQPRGLAGGADVPEHALEAGFHADDQFAPVQFGEGGVKFGGGAAAEATDFAVNGHGVDLAAVQFVQDVQDVFGYFDFAGSHGRLVEG